MKKYLKYFVLALLVVIQFFQISINTPPINPASDFLNIEKAPEAISDLFQGACYDCHSSQTSYPWYASIQPIGWWLRGHVRGAQQHLSYSKWVDYDKKKRTHKIEEMIEEIGSGSMPVTSYKLMHPESNLTQGQRDEMAEWLKTL